MTAEDDEGLQTLLRWAGRRPTPPDEVAAAVYQHSRRVWQTQVQRRKTVRGGFAWAAGVVALVMASWGAWNLYPHQVIATAPAGQAVLITHTLWHPFAGRRGGELYVGDAIQTGAMGALVHRADGSELSVSLNTRLSLASASTVRLWRGRLYVQTLGVPRTQGLVVSTDLGSVEHLGTQFLVERENDALLVAVRDGRVEIHYPQHQPVELQDGEAARVDPHGDLRRWDLSAFDDIWDWADGLESPLSIDGQSLYAVLRRIAQRSGLALRFATPATETEARSLALHGAPLELQPRDALAAVLATTTLSATTVGREIVVSAR
jgi:ferric-dicitrate binding protein FerR (iron transport regulator)